MIELISKLFETEGFPPRWECGTAWTPFLGYVHILSDTATWAAYLTIPIVLVIVARRQKDFPLNRLFFLFAAFILACGTVHLVEAIIFYVPIYRFSALLKLLTAGVSWATVLALIQIAPQAIELPALKKANEKLTSEIRKRNAAERRLARSERQFRETFENAAVGIAHVGVDGRWLRVNQQLCRIVGYNQSELLKGSFQEITHEADLDKDLQKVEQVLSGAIEQYSIEKRYIKKNGHIIWVSLTVSLVRDEDGTPEYFISVVQDINDRKLVEEELKISESRLKLAKELASVGVLLCDYQQQTITLDDVAARIFDLPAGQPLPREEVHGRFHLEDRATIERALAQVLEGEHNGRVSLEHRVVQSDGTVLWVDVCKQIEYDSIDGVLEPSRALIAAIDQTERKQHEQLLDSARKQAESANQARGEFLANMSHEIRTPMAAIMGHVDILLGHIRDPDNRHCATIIKRNGHHLLEIINDILDLSRIEAGKLEVRNQVCDLNELLSDLDNLMRVRVDRSQVDFRVTSDSDVPRLILTDSKRLKQILINLLGNAIKFTRQGEVVLKVGVSETRVGQATVLVFSVSDTGIGISREFMNELFQPFSQGDASRTREFGGSGLGLAISKRLVNLLEGAIEVDSVEGRGTTFQVFLPVQVDPASTRFSYQAEIASEEAIPQIERIHGKILLVDDRRDIRFVGQHFLEEAGANVVIAENGQDAIELIQQHKQAGLPFQAVVMDVQMPTMDGLTAVRRLRQMGEDLPVIALTADAMVEDRERCLNAGYDDYLAKPIDATLLVATVIRNMNQVGGR